MTVMLHLERKKLTEQNIFCCKMKTLKALISPQKMFCIEIVLVSKSTNSRTQKYCPSLLDNRKWRH